MLKFRNYYGEKSWYLAGFYQINWSIDVWLIYWLFWVVEALRAGNKVSSLVEQYSQLQHTTDDAKSPTTPPRGRSPETMEMEDQKYV